MPLAPIPMTREALAELLDDMSRRVSAGDSWEGSLQYEINEDAGDDFLVSGLYRIGNLQGQGGIRTIGEKVACDGRRGQRQRRPGMGGAAGGRT